MHKMQIQIMQCMHILVFYVALVRKNNRTKFVQLNRHLTPHISGDLLILYHRTGYIWSVSYEHGSKPHYHGLCLLRFDRLKNQCRH